MSNLDSLQAAFSQRRALKVISGLNNFDAGNVAAVVQAADRGNATFIDIAASPHLVKMAKQRLGSRCRAIGCCRCCWC
jgi:hypothetical protein